MILLDSNRKKYPELNQQKYTELPQKRNMQQCGLKGVVGWCAAV